MAEGVASSTAGFGWRFTVPLVLAASLNPINSSMVATALVPIADVFAVPVGGVALLVTALYVASAVAQPAMGRTAQQFGPRRVFLVGTILVIASGVVGAFGQNLAMLVVARALLGVGTSAGFPAAILMIRRRADATGEPAGGVLGALVIASQVTVVFGLPLGGLLVTFAGWRATFWINIPLALLVLAAAAKWLPPDERASSWSGPMAIARRLDLLGMLLFAALLATVVAFLSGFPQVRTELAVAAVALAALLVLCEFRAVDPFINFRTLLKNVSLTSTYLRTAGVMLVAYTVMYGLTQWLQQTRGLSATVTGLLIVPMSVAGAVITRPVSRRGLVRMPLVVSAAVSVGAGATLWLVDSRTPLFVIVAVTTVVGIAIGLASFGNQSAVFVQAGAEDAGTAAGLLRTSGYVGAIASGSLITVVFQGGATDSGLNAIADVLIPVSMVVFALTVFTRRLPKSLALAGSSEDGPTGRPEGSHRSR